MRGRGTDRLAVAACVVAACVLPDAAAWAQYREYYVRGRVVDTQKQPIADVQVEARDPEASRSFRVKTGKDGVFKLAGLPHGVYTVTLTKEGYATKEDEWDFHAPQETMQRVEMADVVLASEAQVQQAARTREEEAATKDAVEKLRRGEVDAAIPLLERLARQHPDSANAHYFLGLGYARKGRCGDAIAPLTRVTELTPGFAAARFELGVCHRRLGDLPKALAAFDETLELDPANADSAYNAGLILFETNEVDEALARFGRGLASKPEDVDLLEMAGRCFIHQAKLDRALASLEKARARTTDAGRAAFLDGLIAKVRAQLQ